MNSISSTTSACSYPPRNKAEGAECRQLLHRVSCETCFLLLLLFFRASPTITAAIWTVNGMVEGVGGCEQGISNLKKIFKKIDFKFFI